MSTRCLIGYLDRIPEVCDDVIFSYRVAGILIHNDKVLLQRPENDDYAIIGGYVSLLETSVETLKREYQEELQPPP